MEKNGLKCSAVRFLAGLLLASSLVFVAIQAFALTNDDCLGCHGDPDFATERNGKTVSLYVNEQEFKQSVHAQNGCTSCHVDAEVPGDEHPAPLAPVNCGNCHEKIAKVYRNSLHGKKLAAHDKYAPHCYDCHTKHFILRPSDKRAPTYILNIPFTCGACHKEGSPMTKVHKIPRKDILKNYSMSIHADGLYRKGLVVTAVCTSCHTAHDVLPHTDPKSTISRRNIVKTCMHCHADVEEAHVKIIRGELWQKAPEKIPVCVECHAPHKTRRVLYKDSMNDAFCMKCHSNPKLKKVMPDGSEKSLYVSLKDFKNSIHSERGIACVKCHVNVNQLNKPVCKDSGRVDCSICHADQNKKYEASIHGQLVAKKDPNAPHCSDCHGSHDILTRENPASPTFARNIPDLCARCHREGERAALRYTGSQHEIIKHYEMSIHGTGLSQAGLMVSATCTSCHTAHSILPASDPESTVNRNNVIKTCAKCHLGIAETFRKSIHSRLVDHTRKKLPVCNDCHTSHTIQRVDLPSFRLAILLECGTCHKEESETYFQTYHGRASLLSGGSRTAKCSDCHGSHDIQPVSNPNSRLNPLHVVQTCKKCHPNSNRKFTGYLTHATHHDKKKYPYLYYTFWAMTSLLIGTFAFFGIHTLFWIPRSFRERFERRREHSRDKPFT